jgi:acyl-CoA synthetase (AMP-forming)/AMP-acid ligase II
VAPGDRLRDGGRLGHERDLRDRHQQPGVAQEFSGTIGLPLPSIDIAIKDDDGNRCPGERGEICIAAPT